MRILLRLLQDCGHFVRRNNNHSGSVYVAVVLFVSADKQHKIAVVGPAHLQMGGTSIEKFHLYQCVESTSEHKLGTRTYPFPPIGGDGFFAFLWPFIPLSQMQRSTND